MGMGSGGVDGAAGQWEETRRSFLRRLGVGATAAAVGPLVLPTEPAGASGHVHETLRLRRWAMVVDQRYCDGCAGLGIPPQCTQYCNWGRIVPEGMEWIEGYRPVEERGGTEMPAVLDRPVSFAREVLPIFMTKAGPHAVPPENSPPPGHVRLDSYQHIMASEGLVVPGRPEESTLVSVLLDPAMNMPPSGPPLAPEEIQLVVSWVAQGAADN